MTAQLAAPNATSGTLMMTADEARACIARIKAGLEDIRVAGVELEEREGWKALGYPSWRACASDLLGKSVATVYRQFRAAKIARQISHDEKNRGPLPVAHADELARLPDPESRRQAYADATPRNGEPTRRDVRAAVDRHPAAKPERRSLSSKAEAGDFADDAPDYADQSQDAGDFEVNNEPRRGPLTSHFCSNCGSGSDHTTDLCPFGADAPADRSGDTPAGSAVGQCATAEPAPPTILTDRGLPDAGDSSGVLPGTTDDEADASSGPAATVTLDDLSDEYPNLTAQMAKDPDLIDGQSVDDQRPYADDDPPELQEQRPREPFAARSESRSNGHTGFSAGVGKSAGSKCGSQRVTLASFSDRELTADELARALLDNGAAVVKDAILENATPAHLNALRTALNALGGTSQPTPAAPSALTLKDVKAAIRATWTLADIRSLENELPMLRKEIGARERQAERALAANGAAVS